MLDLCKEKPAEVYCCGLAYKILSFAFGETDLTALGKEGLKKTGSAGLTSLKSWGPARRSV